MHWNKKSRETCKWDKTWWSCKEQWQHGTNDISAVGAS